MHTEKFKVKNTNSAEIEIEVLTNDNVLNPDVPVSLPVHALRQLKHEAIQKLLTDLMQQHILVYDKQEGNEHLFRHKFPSYLQINSISYANKGYLEYALVYIKNDQFECQRVNIRDEHGTVRTLENMLYAICQKHGINAPEVIRPKNLLMTMYERYKHPLSLVTAVAAYSTHSVVRNLRL